jgi:hypothetical protein
MQTGVIMTMGARAVCIQTSDGQQYYALQKQLENRLLEKYFVSFQKYWKSKHYWAVCFEIDTKQFSYSSNGIKRYFAKNVKLLQF